MVIPIAAVGGDAVSESLRRSIAWPCASSHDLILGALSPSPPRAVLRHKIGDLCCSDGPFVLGFLGSNVALYVWPCYSQWAWRTLNSTSTPPRNKFPTGDPIAPSHGIPSHNSFFMQRLHIPCHDCSINHLCLHIGCRGRRSPQPLYAFMVTTSWPPHGQPLRGEPLLSTKS